MVNIESMKEQFDKKFPQAKMLREMELRRTPRNLFYASTVGKATSIIYLLIALAGFFVYWRFLKVHIVLSILLGVITWFAVTYIFDKIFIKISGVEGMVRKINDKEIENSERKLEQTLKEKGVSMDDLLK